MSLFGILIPILLTDIVNPVLLAAIIYSLGSKKPYLNSILILSGWFVVYLGSGVGIAHGLETLMEFFNNPRTIDFYIEIVVSALLLFFGLKMLFKKSNPSDSNSFERKGELSPFMAFTIGAGINVAGLVFAIPYFAAIDQILKADLSWMSSFSYLFAYNLLYILPFSSLLLIRLINKEKSEIIMQNLNSKMGKIGGVLLPAMMILIAFALIYDSYLFFTTGTPWF